jgi:hypothetical protein
MHETAETNNLTQTLALLALKHDLIHALQKKLSSFRNGTPADPANDQSIHSLTRTMLLPMFPAPQLGDNNVILDAISPTNVINQVMQVSTTDDDTRARLRRVRSEMLVPGAWFEGIICIPGVEEYREQGE